MLNKILLSILLVSTLSLSSIATASDLKHSMRDLNQSYKAFIKSKKTEDALYALNNMHDAVVESKQFRPKKLKASSDQDEQVLAYEAILDDLLKNIDETKKLLLTDQFDVAKKNIVKIDELKKLGHQKFR
jgi:soluble cytochrome b562